MQSPDIRIVKILDDYLMHLTFTNGEEREFDLKPYIKYPVFKALSDINELKSFKIIDGTVEWKCGADLSIDTFYIQSKPNVNNAVI
jgi:hypothetical protein